MRVLLTALVLAALFVGAGCKSGEGDDGGGDKQDRLDTVSGKPPTD